MYIRILNECNMSCDHCMMNCERGVKGEHMNHGTFARALDFAKDYGEHITIGGGEPTMHKDFFDFCQINHHYC